MAATSVSWETLDRYEIPRPACVITASLDEAIRFLERAAGRAVVLKAVTDEHKLRLGLVMTNLRTAEQLSGAWRDLASRSAPPFLLQEQVKAGPEVIVGVRHDPSFGAVVLLGLGGRFADALARRAIRLAPITHTESDRMVVALLGEPLPRLSDILVKVAQLIADRPNLQELDLNPVILSPSGPCAIDLPALDGPITPGENDAPGAREAIRRMLQPRSVAIVGASANLVKPGGRALRYLRQSAPDLPVHAVNPRREIIEGVQTVGQSRNCRLVSMSRTAWLESRNSRCSGSGTTTFSSKPTASWKQFVLHVASPHPTLPQRGEGNEGIDAPLKRL